MPSLAIAAPLSMDSPVEKIKIKKMKKGDLEPEDLSAKGSGDEKKKSKKSKKVETDGSEKKKKKKKASSDDSSDEKEKKRKISDDENSAVPNGDSKKQKTSSMEKEGLGEEAAENPNSVTNFRISEPLRVALKSKGIESLFPIQAMTFDLILDGSDLVGRARTGQVRLKYRV